MSITREQAWDLLAKYNHEPFHLRHAITVEHVMGVVRRKAGLWGGEGVLVRGGPAPRPGL